MIKRRGSRGWMIGWAGAILAGMLFAGSSLSSCQYKKSEGTNNSQPGTQAKGRELTTPGQSTQTIITPHFEQEMTTGKNILWCATLQLAWNELLTFAGGTMQMENEGPLVTMLNRQTVNVADLGLDQKSYLTVAGIVGTELLSKVKQTAQAEWQSQVFADLAALPQDSLVAYSYLVKTLPFEWAFRRFDRPLRYSATEVTSFGIKQYLASNPNDQKLANQVLILAYQEDTNFILELYTRSPNDRLILAKVTPEATLGATVTHILGRINQGTPTRMRNLESLVIPVVDVDRLQNYPELCGHPILASNAAVNGKQLSLVAQRTRFKLDETGARLESKALAVSAKPPRQFIFDHPFLVMLIRQGAKMPYFALWVENTDVLVPFK
jgi:hypothetical protein